MGSRSGSGQTLLGLIVGGDVDAAAGFYDRRAPSVREYCLRLCPEGLVDEATLAAFVDFRSRATVVAPDVDVGEVLRRAARSAAAGRFDLHVMQSDPCRATPELLAARMNGELTRSGDALERHLEACSTCRQTSERLMEAEAALIGPGGDPPAERVRITWLELVEAGARPEPAPPADAPGVGDIGTTPRWVEFAQADGETPGDPRTPENPPDDQREPGIIHLHRRRGGLLEAAKRLGSSALRNHQR